MTASARLQLGAADLLADFAAFQRGAPDLFRRKVPSAARRVTKFAKDAMPGAAPPDPRPRFPNRPYPLRWTTERQRRAFFATDGFGGGVPHRRTGELMRSWATRTDFEEGGDGVFILENTLDIARYVIGDDQQLYHGDIGWEVLGESDVFAEVAAFAADQIVNLHNALVDDWLNA